MNLLRALLFPVLTGGLLANEPALYQNPQAGLELRVEDLLKRLTLEEKVGLLYGSFKSGGVERLGIPPLKLSDGPVGIRSSIKTTALPCTLSLSATWDVAAARIYGDILSKEMLALKQNVLFGPGIDLMRDPTCGRNFEYMGEDPFLVSTLAVNYIQAVQANGVAACVKHLVANDTDHRRHSTSSNMNERTLREAHLLAFEMAARDGHVWSMMSGNNLFNGLYVAENAHVQQNILKGELGFDGVLLTDWRGAYDPIDTANGGTDMTMGLAAYVYSDGRFLQAVKNGIISRSLLDDKVRRVIRLYVRCGVLDPSRAAGAIDTTAHRDQARRLAIEGTVLLKNDRAILPLDVSRLRHVLVTGPASDRVPLGHGSGFVNSTLRITPLAGLKAALGDRITFDHVKWEITGPEKISAWRSETGLGTPPSIANLEAAARGADVVVFFATDEPHGENDDMADIDLPSGQNEAIRALAAVNPNIIVVLLTGQPVTINSWVQEVPAVLEAWYAGQATGDALADILIGKSSPGGRLSCTFGKELNDYAARSLGVWPSRLLLDKDPGEAGKTPEDRKRLYAFAADYKEGVFIGYRWFDQQNIEPLFPFGFGLSYTTFAFGDLAVDSSHDALRVTCTVRNTGNREGSEVVQVYIAPPKSSVPRPIRELKGFAKVHLNPGESRQVEIILRPAAIAYYDQTDKLWKAAPGDYQIEIGASSRDIRLKSTIKLAVEKTFARY